MPAVKRGSALALTIALAMATGCTRTLDVRRGELLRRIPGEQTSTDAGKKLEVDDGVVTLNVLKKQCTDVTLEYAQLEKQEVHTMLTDKVGIGLLLMGIGGALTGTMVYFDVHKDVSPALLLSPISLLIMGFGGAVYGLIGNWHEEEVQVATTEFEQTNQCRTVAERVDGPLPWAVSAAGTWKSGKTDASGRLNLRPIVVDLLKAADREALQRTISGSRFKFEFQLGDVRPSPGLLTLETVPDTYLVDWAAKYDHELTGPALTRWQNCRMIATSLRDTFACQLRM